MLVEAIHKAKGEKAKAKALEEQQTARKEKAKIMKAKKVAKKEEPCTFVHARVHLFIILYEFLFIPCLIARIIFGARHTHVKNY